MPVISLKDIIDGAPITATSAGKSHILASIMAKYFVQGGIQCIGSFLNSRHVFRWNNVNLELDRCKVNSIYRCIPGNRFMSIYESFPMAKDTFCGSHPMSPPCSNCKPSERDATRLHLHNDDVISNRLSLLNSNHITYVINLTSKTALFFHGIQPTSNLASNLTA